MRKIKELNNPAILLMMVGFVISFISVLIGISSLEQIIISLKAMNSTETPIYSLMVNSGIGLSFEIYAFSLVNCLVVTNYWIISKRRELAIFKAFGFSNCDLLKLVMKEIILILVICLLISMSILLIVSKLDILFLPVIINFTFVLGTMGLLILSLVIALIMPLINILEINPAEGIS